MYLLQSSSTDSTSLSFYLKEFESKWSAVSLPNIEPEHHLILIIY